jgi:hypothetical protein
VYQKVPGLALLTKKYITYLTLNTISFEIVTLRSNAPVTAEELYFPFYINVYKIIFSGVVMDWIHLAQDTDQWRVLLNTVMNLRVP